MNRRRVLLVLLLILTPLCAFGILRYYRPLMAKPAPIPETYRDANGKTFSVAISPNRIGVLVRDGVTTKQALDVLKRFGLKLVQELPDGLLILHTDLLTREQLVKLARDLRTQAGQVVGQAGLVVKQEGASDPFIATDELIVGTKPDVSPDAIDKLHRFTGAQVVTQHPFIKRQTLLRLAPDSQLDAFQAAKQYQASGLVEYAFPNFISIAREQQGPPNDPLFSEQWHHQNTGQNSGTVGADAATLRAWAITQGTSDTVIAIVEPGGFEMGHPDLSPNLWVNETEKAGTAGFDDDGNGYVDDVNGWNFRACTLGAGTGCGDNNPAASSAEIHGTAVAGVAAARGNNSIGVSGACPQCRLMLLRTRTSASDYARSLAIGYASANGAQLINNSWEASGLPDTQLAVQTAAASGRSGLGTIVVFGSGNHEENLCDPTFNPFIVMPEVIAVSGSTNQDHKVLMSSTGACVDLLAPTHKGYKPNDIAGTLNITTTDRMGNSGYNHNSSVPYCPELTSAYKDYTRCFQGTSSSAPLVTGIAALALTVRPSLTRVELQRVLQDSADKIEDSAGHYSDVNGYSQGTSGTPTHAYGRINAYEAVRIVAPSAQGGRAGVDLFLRDNRLDWGNTPSNVSLEPTRVPLDSSRSVDIKVDAPPFLGAIPANSIAFDAFASETAKAGQTNRVYVRVHNRGPVTASGTLKLHWALASTTAPLLPADFWAAFPTDSTNTADWHPVPAHTINVAYSGSSIAGTATDPAIIMSFDVSLPATAAPPNKVILLAIADADPVDRPAAKAGLPAGVNARKVEEVTAVDNNVATNIIAIEPVIVSMTKP